MTLEYEQDTIDFNDGGNKRLFRPQENNEDWSMSFKLAYTQRLPNRDCVNGMVSDLA